MRRQLAVIGLGLSVLGGCWGWGYHHRGYYGGGYYAGGGGYTYSTYAQPQPQGQVYVEGQPQPQPVQGQVVVQQGQPGQVQGVSVGVNAQIQGEGIQGSDGTRGWRIGTQQPQQEFQRLAQLAARMNCQVEQSNQAELRAVCSNVHVVMRFDQQNVYKLCAPNTDANVCAQTWSGMP
jgi:hypothetical protein